MGGVTNTFSFTWIDFHANGVVRRGSLATDTTATKVVGGGVTNTFSFSSTAHIYFHSNGVVLSGSLTIGAGGSLPAGSTGYEGGGYSERCH